MNGKRIRPLRFATLVLAILFIALPSVSAAAEARRDAVAANGMVASAHPEASRIGVEILEAGGNAVDAAVAVGFALGVVEPNASGIGGGGLMLLWLADREQVVFIDFREKAPTGAVPDLFELDEDGKVKPDARGFDPAQIGGRSVAVPGEVAGLLLAHEEFGSMSRAAVMQPAIERAEQGVVVSEVLAGMIAEHYDTLLAYPASAAIYLSDDFPKMPGDLVRNTELAGTLRRVAEAGRDGFYTGPVAESIVAAVQADGGSVTLADLAGYLPSYRAPVNGNYRGYDIVSAAPPSSGGTHVIELLNIMEHADLAAMDPYSVDTLHLWAEAMKLVYADRAEFMGDSDYVDVPLQGLSSDTYARGRFGEIDPERAAERGKPGTPRSPGSGSTTHYSVIDSKGNMVACTKTINHFFGSGITAPGTGVLLNDQMDDFDKRPGQANSITAGKKPLSSMSPTLLLKDGKPVATLGSPGGLRIISTMAMLISNLVDHGMDIQAAIEAPRINQYEDGPLKVEARIPEDIRAGLSARGHEIEVKKDFDLYFGGAQGVVIRPDAKLHGGADPRRDGQAEGY